ncbi:MAG: cytochrome c oxidase subunit II transmembrane domain-containing protein [Alicyclobacillaceae bacterium]|nr:cytochrome c oxidase subunit II transmembrane domain-containing protein [Alicyclobacillaceae bacterium]
MGSPWLPAPIPEMARGGDQLFFIVTGVSVVVFVLVELLLAWFLLRYRRVRADQRGVAVHGRPRLEIIWTVVPALIVGVVIGIISTKWVYAQQHPAPGTAGRLSVQAAGQKWLWKFESPNGLTSIDELHPGDPGPIRG